MATKFNKGDIVLLNSVLNNVYRNYTKQILLKVLLGSSGTIRRISKVPFNHGLPKDSYYLQIDFDVVNKLGQAVTVDLQVHESEVEVVFSK